MLVVPCPLVSVPLVIVQLYVEPAVGLTMFAARPVAFAQAFAGALICALGGVQATVAAAENGDVPSAKEVSVQVALPRLVVRAAIESPRTMPGSEAHTSESK